MRALLLLPVLLTLGASPPAVDGGTPAAVDGGAAAQCSRDDDCVIMMRCACECCPNQPFAATKAENEAERRRCMVLGPCAQRGCPTPDCPKQERWEDFKAVCRAGRCERERLAPAAAADAGVVKPAPKPKK